MDIVHASRIQWGENLAAHRHGAMAHKILFEGEEGSPDNFLLVLAREGADYFSPRHRHAWDQVRYCLEGSVPIGRDSSVGAGEVAYFPEGVPYGPQQDGPDRIELLLQFGGASGQGYLSAAQMRRAREELSRDGAFEGGVYRRAGKNQDAYEAIWQHVTGKPLDYPRPRYEAPIVMRPGGFDWHRTNDGVEQKFVGLFFERGLVLKFVRIAAGAAAVADADARMYLIFVCEGEGRCGGEPFAPGTAIRLAPGEAAAFTAETDCELFVIGVTPVLSLP